MMKRLLAPMSVLLTGLLLGPALGQDDQMRDQIIDVAPCHFLCGLWRNLSRNAQVASSTPIYNGPMQVERTPSAVEGIGVPRPSELAAVRGSIMVPSASDLAESRRQKARLEREMSVKPSYVGHLAKTP